MMPQPRPQPISASAPPAADPTIRASAVPAPRPRLRRALTWLCRIILVSLLLLCLYLTLFPTGRANARALALLPSLLTASDAPPLSLVGPPVRHTSATVPSRSGAVLLDIYEPASPPPPIPGAREGIIIIPGVGDNRSDAQLINLSSSLARDGLVVMDMTTPALLAYTLTPDDADAVIQSFERLARWPGVGAGRIGVLGFSAGGAIACFAAADPRIRDRLAFITLFGGYFDATTLLRDFGRRALLVNGALRPWTPNLVPVQVLANTIATTLPDADAQTLTAAFLVGAPALTPDQLLQLSPPAIAAYHLLAGDQPAAVDANLAALSPTMRALLRSLSPSASVAAIRTHIYLLHDRNDMYVPYTQSRAFDATLRQLGRPHDYAEFGIFAHVEVKASLGLGSLLGDSATLFRILSAMLLPSV